MTAMVFKYLDDALAVVANASFHEDKSIRPVADGWEVDSTTGHMSDEWTWTYETGVMNRDSVSETSRLHEACESYVTAAHIRYNMPESVELLEARQHVVEFAYAIVRDDSVTYDEDGNAVDSDGEFTDDLAGWMLVANHYDRVVWND